jgi:hypothetical protein
MTFVYTQALWSKTIQVRTLSTFVYIRVLNQRPQVNFSSHHHNHTLSSIHFFAEQSFRQALFTFTNFSKEHSFVFKQTTKIKMQFTTALLALAATAVALPNVGPSPKGNEVGKQEAFWPVSDEVTVEEAKAACGTDNQIACCDDTTFTGDQVEVESGPLAGALKDLLGGKNGAKGLGLFDKCSKLNLDSMSLISLVFFPLLTHYSHHRYLRSRQQPVQAEHCLLPGQHCRLRGRPHRTQRSLHRSWFSFVKGSMYNYLFSFLSLSIIIISS